VVSRFYARCKRLLVRKNARWIYPGRRAAKCASWCAENLLNLCWHHHHLVHEGRWQITFNANTDKVTVIRPDGREYRPPEHPPGLTEKTRQWLANLTGAPPGRTTAA
jgi:hypothetical protein